MPAPIGYLNTGSGNVKIIDPVKAPLIKTAFELYATGKFSLRSLAEEMAVQGLWNRYGQPLTDNGMSILLHNLFYIGIIKVKPSGEYFVGKHHPIISKALFNRVQATLKTKNPRKQSTSSLIEAFLFRRLLSCKRCSHRLIAEQQKGYVYYRCHTSSCPQKTIREGFVTKAFKDILKRLRLRRGKTVQFQKLLTHRHQQLGDSIRQQQETLKSKLVNTQNQLLALTDKFIGGTIDERLFVLVKNQLIIKEQALQLELDTVEAVKRKLLTELETAFQFAQSALVAYEQGDYAKRREIINTLAANITVQDKSVEITFLSCFEQILHNPSGESNEKRL